MNITFLQVFLAINIFIIGVVLTLAIQHAYAHFKPQPKSIKKTTDQSMHLPNAIREHLLEQSQAKFQAVLDRSSKELEHDLQIVTERIDKQIDKFSTAIVNDETKRYRDSLDKLRKQTESSMLNAEVEIAKHQVEIEAKLAERQKELEGKMEAEISAEKARRIAQIDSKLSDAVSSFLIETLGHNVDLGAQNEYLMKLLDENKAELIKSINNEA